MNRQEISAFLANCEVSKMMAYADLGDGGTVVVAEDGKKYRYSNDQLDQAESEAKAQARASKPKPKPKPKPRRTTKRQAAAGTPSSKRKKPTTKPPTKPTTKPTTKAGNGR